jgi:site-specific recombinase XerD
MDGGDLGTLADLMGHSSVLVTKDFYGIFTAEQLREKHGQHSPIAQIYNENKKEL